VETKYIRRRLVRPVQLAATLGIAAMGGIQPCAGQGFIISTFAGGGPYITSIGNGQPATSAFLNAPSGVAVDAAGNVYISDTYDNMLRKVALTGIINAFAGTGSPGFSGDGGSALNAQLHAPGALAVDMIGNVYIADTSNNRVRKVDTAGIITTVAGSSNTLSTGIGDGGSATSAVLSSPRGMVLDSSGNLYIADSGNRRVRRVDTNGTITTFAGNGYTGSIGAVGDSGAPTSATLTPAGIALDNSGNMYIADYVDNLIRKVSNGVITSVAGTGTSGYYGDGSTATNAYLSQPQSVAVDGSGHVFFADTGNQVIREVSGGVINTVAGNGGVGSYGDGGPAGAATLDSPVAIALSSTGLIFICNTSTNGYKDAKIRLLTPASGTVPAIATNGIVPVFSTSTSITPGSWISIYGSNLASGTTVWNGDFPTVLGQVAVTIDSKPAYLWYVSPSQINCQVPDDSNSGTVTVAVTTPGGSATQSVRLTQYSPSLSLFSSKYPVAVVYTPGSPGNSGNGYDIIGPPGTFSFPTRPAVAGETVVLYGVGFGPTSPTVPAGQAYSGVAYVVAVPNISIGDIPATVTFAGIVQAGLYQFNVVVPDAGSGDAILFATVNGFSAQSKLYLTLK
jgi:uncharacterized protein (TIGR03437 family)